MSPLRFMRLTLAAIVGYLLGSFPSADVASRLATRGEIDLRSQGTGNPGTANAAAVLGKGWGALVFALDFVKGALASLAGRALGGDDGTYVAATSSVAGHNWPVWSGFRGGKGVATAAGACLPAFPGGFPIVAAALGGGAAITKNAPITVQLAAPVYVSAATTWWQFGLANRGGPRPTAGLPLYALATSAMVLGKFRTAKS